MGFGGAIKRLVGAVFPRLLLYRGKTTVDPVVALTFDDGPHPLHSPRILDVLAEHEITASFFVIGEEAEKYPELIRRMRAEGHEVANHTYSHYGAVHNTPKGYVEDVKRCQAVLEDICGQRLTKSFRPPYGTVPPAVFVRLLWLRYRLVLWSVDSNDSRVGGAEELLHSIEDTSIVPGDVILLHEDYAHTLQVLPEFIRVLRGRGFGFVPSNRF